jgi:hypothetical protein
VRRFATLSLDPEAPAPSFANNFSKDLFDALPRCREKRRETWVKMLRRGI